MKYNARHFPDFSYFRVWRIILLTGVLLPVSTMIPAQSIANIGFETGTLSGWIGATGQCCPVYTPQQGLDTSRHVITSGSLIDPYSLGLIPVVAPGSLFSARLGNDQGDAESEIMQYYFNVPSDSMLLVIRFAVILENANHPPVKQPRFRYELQGSGPLPTGCLTEEILAGDPNYNFIINGTYEVLSWQTRIIDLTGYQGNSYVLHFETGDCEPGGHFGYAYVDGDLIPSKINVHACNNDGSAILYAPSGINITWFDGSTGDSVIVSQPANGMVYTLETDCNVVLTAELDSFLPHSNFTADNTCGIQVAFNNNSSYAPGSAFIWDFGDSGSGNDQNPVHTYNSPGIYAVELTVQQPNNCISSSTQLIELYESPQAAFIIAGNCVNEEIKFTSQSTGGSAPMNHEWFMNGSLFASEPDPIFIFNEPGLYEMLLVVSDDHNCSDSLVMNLEIHNADSCFIDHNYYIPNAFTPNGDGHNDYFEIDGDDPGIDFVIFSRFGELIYSGKKWDGTYNSQQCPQGIYAYFVGNEKRVLRHGTCTLVR